MCDLSFETFYQLFLYIYIVVTIRYMNLDRHIRIMNICLFCSPLRQRRACLVLRVFRRQDFYAPYRPSRLSRYMGRSSCGRWSTLCWKKIHSDSDTPECSIYSNIGKNNKVQGNRQRSPNDAKWLTLKETICWMAMKKNVPYLFIVKHLENFAFLNLSYCIKIKLAYPLWGWMAIPRGLSSPTSSKV